MSSKRENRKLREENFMLKLEVWRLKGLLESASNDLQSWKHPRSCLHNEDPWEHWD